MLAEALSKADEIELFESIVANCPEGYVKDILCGISLQVHDAIRNDFCAITADLQSEMQELLADKERLAAEVAQLREQSEKLVRQYQMAKSTIHQAESLARQLKATVADIRDL